MGSIFKSGHIKKLLARSIHEANPGDRDITEGSRAWASDVVTLLQDSAAEKQLLVGVATLQSSHPIPLEAQQEPPKDKEPGSSHTMGPPKNEAAMAS